MRQAFILYKRKGFVNYYAAFWDEKVYGYSSWRSTSSLKRELGEDALHLSTTSKAGARSIAELWLQKNNASFRRGNLSFIEYLEGFWKSDGEYAQNLRVRGRTISEQYLSGNRSAIKRVREFLEARGEACLPLGRTTVGMLEDMIFFLQKTKKISARRNNAIMQAVAVPLAEAERKGMIRDNPARRVRRLPEKTPERILLSPDEVRVLFRAEWPDPRQKAINLLAATTGMRLGECRGLLMNAVHDDWIDIKNNWQDDEGLKIPKWGKARAVPAPQGTVAALRDLNERNPWRNEFVFWGSSQDRPIGKRSIALAYRHALGGIGITQEEIAERHLSFHAWRHWYNSMLRGHVPDHALRRLTGHSSGEMTERYTVITDEQRHAVARLAEGLV